jgi:hypothetical protein
MMSLSVVGHSGTVRRDTTHDTTDMYSTVGYYGIPAGTPYSTTQYSRRKLPTVHQQMPAARDAWDAELSQRNFR